MKTSLPFFRLAILFVVGTFLSTVAVQGQNITSVQVPSGAICLGATITVTVTLASTPGTPKALTISLGNTPLIGNGCGIGNEAPLTGNTISTSTSTFSYIIPTSIGILGTSNRKIRVEIAGGNTVCSSAFNINGINLNPSYNLDLGGCKGTQGSLRPVGILVNPIPTGSYSWAGPGGFNSTSSSPNYTPTTGGVFTFSVSATSNSCTSSATTSTSINGETSISPTTAICIGSSVNLTAVGGNSTILGPYYSWSASGGAFNTSASNPTIYTPETSGNMTISVTTLPNGLSTCSATATAVITVNPLPTVSISVVSPTGNICQGATLSLTAANNGTSVGWAVSGGTPGGFNTAVANPSYTVGAPPSLAPSAGRSFSVTVTNVNSCTNSTTLSITYYAKPTLSISPSTSNICQGQALNLTATAGLSNYAWANSGGTFASTTNLATFSNSSVGGFSFSVTATNSNSCTNSATASTSVNVNPTVSINPSSTNVCAGQTINLTATPGLGGYAWGSSGGAFTSTTNLATFSSSSGGSFSFSVTATNNINSCTSLATATATVRPTTAVSIAPSDAKICEGTSLILTATPGIGSYAWSSSGGTFTSTTNQATFKLNNGLGGGVFSFSVTVTNTYTCTSGATATVSVVTKPSADFTTSSGKFYLCPGKTLDLVGIYRDDVTYEWLLNNSAMVPPGVTSTITITLAGPYTLKVTGIGACKTTDSKTIYVNTPTPLVASATNTTNSTKIVLEANPTGMQYTWSGPSSFTSAERKPTITPVNSSKFGVYTVVLTAPSSGCSASATTSVSIAASRIASLEESEEMELSAYPNPTSGQMSVVILLAEPSAVKLRLSNGLGNYHAEWKLDDEVQRHETSINLSQYQPGMYLLQAETNNKKIVKKILKIE
ncbi:MAG: T9SS type A sorting domain-containing protein [Spirosomataceae bacterium]